MKKALLVTSLVVISALSFAPTAKAFSINIPGINLHIGDKEEVEDKDEVREDDFDKVQKCKKIFHGTEVSEEHESEQAEIHENDDERADCETPAPSESPTASPTATPIATPTGTPASTPVSTPTGSPTATPTGTPTASPTATPTVVVTGAINVQDLITQIRQMIQDLVKSFQD